MSCERRPAGGQAFATWARLTTFFLELAAGRKRARVESHASPSGLATLATKPPSLGSPLKYMCGQPGPVSPPCAERLSALTAWGPSTLVRRPSRNSAGFCTTLCVGNGGMILALDPRHWTSLRWTPSPARAAPGPRRRAAGGAFRGGAAAARTARSRHTPWSATSGAARAGRPSAPPVSTQRGLRWACALIPLLDAARREADPLPAPSRHSSRHDT